MNPREADIGENKGFLFVTSDNPARKVVPAELRLHVGVPKLCTEYDGRALEVLLLGC